MLKIEDAFLDVQHGYASKRPVIEMNVPTSLDSSIAPPGMPTHGLDACTQGFVSSRESFCVGKHIALLFVQYTPYEPKVIGIICLSLQYTDDCY